MQKANSLEKTLMLSSWKMKAKGEGAAEDEMVGWHHWCDAHELSKLWEMVKDRGAWSAAVQEVTKSQM